MRLTGASLINLSLNDRTIIMKWETPTATDMRFGFEITMYIANR